MTKHTLSPQGLATAAGALILAASVNTNVMQTGGYFSSHALLVTALSVGVFAGARVVGAGVAAKMAVVIIVALTCGELYNLTATAERIVVEREATAAPLRAAMDRHEAAIEKLRQVETGRAGSPRLLMASKAKEAADAAYQKELREGGRCLSICKGLRAEAEKATLEVAAAAQEAQTLHAKAIEAAKADVAANPIPASATPLADRLGWPAWALDLFVAALLSIGANGLAAVLIGYGAHSTAKPELTVADDAGQSDFEIAKVKALVSGNIPEPPKPRGRKGRKADPKIVDFTSKFRERNGRAPTGKDLRAQFPALPVSTAYDYAARARSAG